MKLPTRKGPSHWVTLVPVHPCKMGIKTPVEDYPGVSPEEWAWGKGFLI